MDDIGWFVSFSIMFLKLRMESAPQIILSMPIMSSVPQMTYL